MTSETKSCESFLPLTHLQPLGSVSFEGQHFQHVGNVSALRLVVTTVCYNQAAGFLCNIINAGNITTNDPSKQSVHASELPKSWKKPSRKWLKRSLCCQELAKQRNRKVPSAAGSGWDISNSVSQSARPSTNRYSDRTKYGWYILRSI